MLPLVVGLYFVLAVFLSDVVDLADPHVKGTVQHVRPEHDLFEALQHQQDIQPLYTGGRVDALVTAAGEALLAAVAAVSPEVAVDAAGQQAGHDPHQRGQPAGQLLGVNCKISRRHHQQRRSQIGLLGNQAHGNDQQQRRDGESFPPDPPVGLPTKSK